MSYLNLLAVKNFVGIIFIVVGCAVVLGVGIYLLYHFVLSRNRYRKQVNDLERKHSYLNALLTGQDSQHIHRLEIISRTNLLYVEKYNEFSRRFKDIYEGEDKFAESLIKQLKTLITNNQYQNIKSVISETKAAINSFEEKVIKLDNDLYNVIKPEEDSRQNALQLKENYRNVKQFYYTNSKDLEFVSTSFNHVFDKLDDKFSQFDNLIEGGEYDDANNLLIQVNKVVKALDSTLKELPNLCVLLQNIIPAKIKELTEKYEITESKGVPLFNISFKSKLENWNIKLNDIQQRLINLQTNGALQELTDIQNEIAEVSNQLDLEVTDRDDFNTNYELYYHKAIELEKSYLKICSLLPHIQGIYQLTEEQISNIEQLKVLMNSLGASKRNLDNFVHSATKQPYSVLKRRLDDLINDYDRASKAIDDFKALVDYLKSTVEEAHTLIFAYYYHCKQIEAILKEIAVETFASQYTDTINQIYDYLNQINALINVRPINVFEVSQKVEELKTIANNCFDDIENKSRESKLAESAIVYANRDRNHQGDVHQQLCVLETQFFNGEFAKVYHDANAIYRRVHVEDNTNNG